MTDVVDSAHRERNCPYCSRPQFWSAGGYYLHLDNLRYCDRERLARWDLSGSLAGSR